MKKTSIILFILFIEFCYSQEYAQKLAKYERTNNFDAIHYKLDIKLDLDTKIIGGLAYITLSPTQVTDSISLDAENMTISSVEYNGSETSFKQSEKRLDIFFKQKYSSKDTLTLCIKYECKSGNSKGIKYFKQDSDSPDKIYQCWTQGQEETNHFWFPCYDFPNDRITSEIIVTLNDKFETVSNGRLLSVKHDKERAIKTFHWLQDKQHVVYLVSLVAGEYIIVKDSYKKIPTPYYVYKGLEKDAVNIFPQTKEMIAFFEEITGQVYPWDKYSQTILQDFFGGMENTSATNLIDWIPDNRQLKYDENYTHFYTTLIAHELAHMWFGDLITCSNWAHLWLNEGFAEFLPGVYYEKTIGKEYSEQYFYDELQSYLNINEKEKMPTAEKGSNNIYPKGALILKMLRYELGENLFWKAIKDYTKSFKNKLVTTSDLQKSIEKSTGRDMSIFFRQWIYRAGHPKFSVNYTYDKSSKKLSLSVDQIQKLDSLTGLFSVNMDIEIVYPKSSVTKTIHIEKEKEIFEFSNINEPITINFDPYNKIIKELKFEKPMQVYVHQLTNSNNFLQRTEAAQMLKQFCDSVAAFQALKIALKKEKALKVKSEIIKTLGRSKINETPDLLMDAFSDRHPQIRRDILFNISNFKNDGRVSNFIFKAFNDSSYSVIASAIQNYVTIDSAGAFEKIAPHLDSYSYRNTVQEHVIGALIRLRDPKAIPIFKKYSISGYSQLARNSCLLGLTTMAKTHSELYDYFIEQLNHDNSYFRRMSVNALVDIGNKEAVKSLEEMLKREKQQFIIKIINNAIKKLRDK